MGESKKAEIEGESKETTLIVVKSIAVQERNKEKQRSTRERERERERFDEEKSVYY